MSKKLKILISALLVAILLTVGATATVMAQGEEETTPPSEESGNTLLGRVAEILGIDEEDLTAAFTQARQEMSEAAFIDRVNEAVAEGLITQEQADAITGWWQQRPDEALGELWGQKPELMEPGMFKHNLTLRFRATPRLHTRNDSGGWFCPEPPEQTN